MNQVSKLLRGLARKPQDWRSFGDLRLPLRRSNHGLKSDEAYLHSVAEQIEPIRTWFSPSARVLDFGCGQGRLLNGLIFHGIGFGQYLGCDVNAASVAWCVSNLSYPSRPVSFLWTNARNDRYNPHGASSGTLSLVDDGFDVIFSNSVFSHFETEDLVAYAQVLFRKLAPGGVFYLTAFTEPGVADCEVNPDGYFETAARNPALLRVRFNDAFFLKQFQDAGFRLLRHDHRGIARSQQSVYCFTRDGH